MKQPAALALLALSITGCAGSPAELASRDDLSGASNVELCAAAKNFRDVLGNPATAKRMIDELYRRGEIAADERDAVLQGKVRIGMGQTAAMCAWGPPSDINRTTFTFGVHEQWVYVSGPYAIPSSFLYFEDGRLVTIQN